MAPYTLSTVEDGDSRTNGASTVCPAVAAGDSRKSGASTARPTVAAAKSLKKVRNLHADQDGHSFLAAWM